MTNDRASAALIGGITLLERAISYTLGSLLIVTPEAMSRPSPCRGWNLRTLLAHMDDSLVALCEAVYVGQVTLDLPDADGPVLDPVATLRSRACGLLSAWHRADSPAAVSIAGSPLTAGILTSAGAIEVTVHGWDVAVACGRQRPIPDSLAEEMLELVPLFVTAADRPGRFGPALAVPPLAQPGERLLAFLGRRLDGRSTDRRTSTR